MDTGPLLDYKLTLWACGSGELKSIKPTLNSKKCLPGVSAFESSQQICQKLKDFWIISLDYAKSLFKNIFGRLIFICEPIFNLFCITF